MCIWGKTYRHKKKLKQLWYKHTNACLTVSLNTYVLKLRHAILTYTEPHLIYYIPQLAVLQSRLYQVEDCRWNTEVCLNSRIAEYEHKIGKLEAERWFCFEMILNNHATIPDYKKIQKKKLKHHPLPHQLPHKPYCVRN